MNPPDDADGPGADDEQRLTDEQFERLADAGEPLEVRAGDVLYATGDASYDFFLLRSATVEVVRDRTATQDEKHVYTRGPGDFLGELNLITGQAVFLTSRVIEDGEVVRLDTSAFRRAMTDHADIADVLLAALRVRRRLMQKVATSALEVVFEAGSPEGQALRTFAARMQLPHAPYTSDSEDGRALMRAHDLTDDALPVAVVSQTVLTNATPRDVADELGLTFDSDATEVDLVVVGAGPAGLAAAVYGASEGLETVLFDRLGPGGQAATTSRIENYLGFPQGVSGEELTLRALVQAQKFGAHLYTPCEVRSVDAGDPDLLTVTLTDDNELRARAVIVATGARYRRLDVPGWEHHEERGDIRYSATELDARDCDSRPVTVVGGANSAGQAALFLATRGSHVDIVVRGDHIESSMSAYLSERLVAHDSIRIHTNAQVTELTGDDDALTAVRIEYPDGTTEQLKSSALFCFIGATPDADWLDIVDRDDAGFILTDSALPDGVNRRHREDSAAAALPFQTSVARIFAAGDVRSGSMQRVASAVGEGAAAVASVHQLLAH